MLGSLLGLTVALAAPAPARAAWSVGVPVEMTWVGLGFGLHPEVVWRPVAPDGALQLRAATGLVIGPELALVPVSLGLRGMALPRRRVSFGPGIGVQLQGFLPNHHPPVARLDLYLELAAAVRVVDGWHATVQVSPEFGLVGGFGLGFSTRAGVMYTFPKR